MSLNARQTRLYNHLCNIWQVTRTVNAATGKPGVETYTLYASAVSCHYEYTPNVDDPIIGVGRVKRQTIITEDTVHFASDQTVQDGWILKNVTILPNGAQSPSYGEFHRVHGAPRRVPNAGARFANKLSVMAMSMEKPPAGVS